MKTGVGALAVLFAFIMMSFLMTSCSSETEEDDDDFIEHEVVELRGGCTIIDYLNYSSCGSFSTQFQGSDYVKICSQKTPVGFFYFKKKNGQNYNTSWGYDITGKCIRFPITSGSMMSELQNNGYRLAIRTN